MLWPSEVRELNEILNPIENFIKETQSKYHFIIDNYESKISILKNKNEEYKKNVNEKFKKIKDTMIKITNETLKI